MKCKSEISLRCNMCWSNLVSKHFFENWRTKVQDSTNKLFRPHSLLQQSQFLFYKILSNKLKCKAYSLISNSLALTMNKIPLKTIVNVFVFVNVFFESVAIWRKSRNIAHCKEGCFLLNLKRTSKQSLFRKRFACCEMQQMRFPKKISQASPYISDFATQKSAS